MLVLEGINILRPHSEIVRHSPITPTIKQASISALDFLVEKQPDHPLWKTIRYKIMEDIGSPKNGMVLCYCTNSLQTAYDLGWRPDPELIEELAD